MRQEILPGFLTTHEEKRQSWHREMLNILGIPADSSWPDEFGRKLRGWSKEHVTREITVLSLFSGGGGLDIGFHDAGFQIIEMVEIDARYVRTLEVNSQPGYLLEGSRSHCTDIRTYHPPTDLQVDFIIGGPPCQTFSAAGRRAAGVSGTDDPRGVLFEEYVRLLKVLKPRGFLFENVYGITGAQDGEAWKDIQDAFSEAGYTICFRILDAADYGVPQHRERLFIVGVKEGDFLFPRPTHGPDADGDQPYYTAGQAVSGADSNGVRPGLSGQYGHLLNAIPPGLNYSFYTEKMGHPNPVFGWRSKFSDFLYKADPDTPVRTIKAQGGQYTGPFSWENRVFSIAELKRLQTIPDDYDIIGNRQVAVEQIGNSVPPQVARILALAVLDQIFQVPPPLPMRYLRPNEELSFRQRKRNLTRIYADKAREAIAGLRTVEVLQHPAADLTDDQIRYMTSHFALELKPLPGSRQIHLTYSLTQQRWLISAYTDRYSHEQHGYEIRVRPVPGRQWVLPTETVVLYAATLDDHVFTALWKAFEEKVVQLTGIADLVQLHGYYQYSPRFQAQMFFLPHTEANTWWMALQLLINRSGVGKPFSEAELALFLNVNISEVPAYCEWLKSIGYEVRNKNTNPQMRAGHYLIPYAFPTLTPRSIQLRKSLRDLNG